MFSTSVMVRWTIPFSPLPSFLLICGLNIGHKRDNGYTSDRYVLSSYPTFSSLAPTHTRTCSMLMLFCLYCVQSVTVSSANTSSSTVSDQWHLFHRGGTYVNAMYTCSIYPPVHLRHPMLSLLHNHKQSSPSVRLFVCSFVLGWTELNWIKSLVIFKEWKIPWGSVRFGFVSFWDELNWIIWRNRIRLLFD